MSVGPWGPDRLSASTRSTGHATKVRSRTRMAAAAAATATSPDARRVGARATRERATSAGGEAAVHHQLGAGHERGLVAGQEQRDVGDVPRLADAAEGNPRLELLAD